MKNTTLAAFAIGACTLALLAVPRAPEGESFDANPSWDLDGELTLLLDVADDLSPSEREAFVAALPGSPSLNSAFSDAEGLYRLTVSATEAGRLIAALEDDPRVEFLEARAHGRARRDRGDVRPSDASASGPNDPLYPFQWHFDQIELERAWAIGDGAGAVVAVIDTGVAFADDDAGRLRAVRDLTGTGSRAGLRLCGR